MFNSPLEQFPVLPLLSFGMNPFDSSITNAMVTTWLGFSIFCMDSNDLVILKLIRMFNSPLEQFPVLDFFFFGMNLFDSLITNAMVTTWLGFSIFCMDGNDLLVKILILMFKILILLFNRLLEEFEILPLLSFGMNLIDTKDLLIKILILLFNSLLEEFEILPLLSFVIYLIVIYLIDTKDLLIKILILLFNSFLEEFEILPLLRFVLFLIYLKARNDYMVKNKYVC